MKSAILVLCLFFTTHTFCQVKLLENTNLEGILLNGKPLLHDTAGTFWTTDGTPAGTTILTTKVKLLPQHDGLVAGARFYFAGTAPATGTELWCTDGTDAGTYLVKNITPGSAGTQLGDFFPCHDKVCFFASDAAHGYELWVTDGTEAGTALLKDISPGTKGSAPRLDGMEQAILSNTVFFQVNDGQHGTEIWKTDGTPQGTQLLKDINPDNNGSQEFPGYTEMFLLGTALLFQADDGIHGRELWRTDGTSAGTMMVKDIHAGDSGSVENDMIVFNNKLFFTVFPGAAEGREVELWSSDGTGPGTQKVLAFPPGVDYCDVALYNAIVFPGRLLFVFSADDTDELWTTGGTANTTQKLQSFGNGYRVSLFNNWEGGFSTQNKPPYNGKVFFSTKDENDGNSQLWITDGTAGGTTVVKAINSWNYSYLYGATRFFFWADHLLSADSLSLNKTDGTAAGTMAVQSFPSPPDTYKGDYPFLLFAYNGEAYYAANDLAGGSLFNDLYRTGTGGSVPPTTYTFIGNGSWDTPSNWQNNLVPPANLTSGEIVINPVEGGECIVYGARTLPAGVKLTIRNNKKMRVLK